MEKLNLVIVANNALVVNGLKHYLKDRYGEDVSISNFYDSRSCLRKMKKDTQVIVTDCFLNGRNAADCLKSVKQTYPNAKIILHSSREEVAAWIDRYYQTQPVSLN